MIHLYYDTTTGVINSATESEFEFDSETPHIHTDTKINIGHYKVNLNTLTLELLPESEWPSVASEVRWQSLYK